MSDKSGEEVIQEVLGEEAIIKVSTEMIGKRRMGRGMAFLVKIFSIALSIFSILYVFNIPARLGLLVINSLTYLNIILGGLMVLTFLAFPGSKGREGKIPWYDFALIILGVTPCLYYLFDYNEIMQRYALGIASGADQVMFIMLFFILLEGSRRVLGLTMPIVVIVIVLYAAFSNYFPGIFRGTGFGLNDLAHTLYLSSSGVWGVALSAAATMVFPFMVFARLLQTSGAGNFFVKAAVATMGRFRGPGAKTATISACLWGMVSGSSTSNVLASGSFTIPMMRKDGASANFAAAIQSVASNGGTIMPPVMGVAAFVMSDFTGIPYGKLIFMAFIPGFLYYLSLLLIVDQEAAKFGWKGLPPDQVPSLGKTLAEGWDFTISLAALIFLLGVWDMEVGRGVIICCLVLIGAVTLKYFVTKRSAQAVATGSVGTTLLKSEVVRIGSKEVIDALQSAAITMVIPGLACATAGFIVGSFMMSGLAIRLSTDLVILAGQNTLLLLVLAAFLSLVLGINLDSIPCYLVLAVLVAPTLVKHGMPVIAAHLFALHWGVISYITPPVCITVFVAASMAQADMMRSGVVAMRVGIACYLVPFIFVYRPGTLLQGSTGQILIDTAIAVVAVFCLSYFSGGWLRGKIGWVKRTLFLLAGLSIAYPNPISMEVGFVILILIVLSIFKPWQKTGLARREVKIGIE